MQLKKCTTPLMTERTSVHTCNEIGEYWVNICN